MTEREKILTRIREALAVPVPQSGHGQRGEPRPQALVQWLPLVGETSDEQLAAFRQNAAALKIVFHALTDGNELKFFLTALREKEQWKEIGTHSGELTDFATQCLALPTLKTDSGYKAFELERCDAGITECDALVAQTGSVLVTSRSAGGRALSVLPPHHVVLARRGQLVRDLPAAFQLLKQKYGENWPGMISFISGPSRTGDIERTLVLGAHGPKKMTVCLL